MALFGGSKLGEVLVFPQIGPATAADRHPDFSFLGVHGG